MMVLFEQFGLGWDLEISENCVQTKNRVNQFFIERLDVMMFVLK